MARQIISDDSQRAPLITAQADNSAGWWQHRLVAAQTDAGPAGCGSLRASAGRADAWGARLFGAPGGFSPGGMAPWHAEAPVRPNGTRMPLGCDWLAPSPALGHPRRATHGNRSGLGCVIGAGALPGAPPLVCPGVAGESSAPEHVAVEADGTAHGTPGRLLVHLLDRLRLRARVPGPGLCEPAPPCASSSISWSRYMFRHRPQPGARA